MKLNNKISSNYDAVIYAMLFGVLTPNDKHSKYAIKLVDELEKRCTEEECERAKLLVDSILELTKPKQERE
jgi:hypothetical protein